MEDLHSSINKGSYMMGVLRSTFEAASGVTYDGQKISDLEKSMLDTDTFADPWKQLAETDERAKAAAAAQAEEERLRKKAEDALRKSPQLPSDAEQVKRFVKKKAKEAVKHAPNLQALHAWDLVVEETLCDDPAWASPATYTSKGGRRAFAVRRRASGLFVVRRRAADWCSVTVLDELPHVSLHASRDTVQRRVVYRYDQRTALVHEKGGVLAPFQAPHDRSVLIAWRAAPPALGCAAGAWLRLRFSVTSALVPETTTHQRCPVVLDAWLLEPQTAASTKVTTWSAEELPEDAPAWLGDAARPTRGARRGLRAAPAKHLHLDEDGLSLPAAVPASGTPRSARPAAETKATAADREAGLGRRLSAVYADTRCPHAYTATASTRRPPRTRGLQRGGAGLLALGRPDRRRARVRREALLARQAVRLVQRRLRDDDQERVVREGGL